MSWLGYNQSNLFYLYVSVLHLQPCETTACKQSVALIVIVNLFEIYVMHVTF